MEKKNVVIYVAGQRFSIATADTPEYVIGIGEKIDVMIKGIQKDNPRLNRDACAILAALDICDDETKLRRMMEVLRLQVKDYLEANETLRNENAELKKRIAQIEQGSTAAKPQTAPITTGKPEEKAKASAKETSASVHTAFVGKDFASDRAKADEPTKPTETTEPSDEELASSAYHQYSIFDGDFS